MSKRCVLLFLVMLLVSAVSLASAAEDEDGGEDIYSDIGEVSLGEDAGITPDSRLYFADELLEKILVGDNPGRALRYKEEKIAEAREMVRAGNTEGAKKAFENAGVFGDILEKEVSPAIEKRARESSKAVKEVFAELHDDLEGDEWGSVKGIVEEHAAKEDKIALAAKISVQIKKLCETLSEIDPLEYSRVCRTGNDNPEWHRNLDRKLTAEQEKEARAFFGIMSECFNNPRKCRCSDISIPAFAKKCSVIAPLAAACEFDGDEEACSKMDAIEKEEPIENLLPDYLREILIELESKYNGDRYDIHMPSECSEAGARTKEDCMKVMFRLNAPPECQEALEAGKINPQNEREARKQCEKIMFDAEAPDECKKAGITDHKECGKYMFKLDAPKECIDAGMDGTGRDDWKKCEAIRFRMDAPKECIDAGIDGTKRDDWKKCDAIRFRSEAPRSCIDAGIDPNDRDAWNKCGIIEFKANAPQACIDAGIDGSGRDDWKKCNRINFRNDADPKCVEAGLTGEHPDDWKKCDEITRDTRQEPDFGGGMNCFDIADSSQRLKCFENLMGGGGFRRDESRHEEPRYEDESECKDGCSDECPGASRTGCINGRCECYYDDDRRQQDPCVSMICPENQHCEGGRCVYNGEGQERHDDTGEEQQRDEPEEPIPEHEEAPAESGQERDGPEEPSPEHEEAPAENEPEPASEGGEITGGAVIDNRFLKYYYR